MLSRKRCLCVVFLLIGLYMFAVVAPANARQNAQNEAVRYSPAAALRSAQTIFIRTKSAYFKPAALEQALLDRNEIQTWGLVISREEVNADLIIEVDRKLFTNIFVYTVIDPRAQTVLISGKIGSLGGTVEGQIANGFVKRLRRFRPLNAPAENK